MSNATPSAKAGQHHSDGGSALDIGLSYVAQSQYFEPFVALPGAGGTETIYAGETGISGPASQFAVACGNTVRMIFNVVPQSQTANVNFVLVITNPFYSTGYDVCPPVSDQTYCTILQVITNTPNFYGWTAPISGNNSNDLFKRFFGLAQNGGDNFLDNSTAGTVTWQNSLLGGATGSQWSSGTTYECEAYPPYNDGSNPGQECYSSPPGNEPITVNFSDYGDESDSIANIPDPPCTMDSYGHCYTSGTPTRTGGSCETGAAGPHGQPVVFYDTKTLYMIYSKTAPATMIEPL